MPTTTHTVDAVEAEQLSTAFNSCFENLAAPDGLFAADAFFDLLPPFWRFQLQGPDAFIAQLRAIAEGEITSRVVRVVASATGFVMEHEETMRGAKTEVARKIWLGNLNHRPRRSVTGWRRPTETVVGARMA